MKALSGAVCSLPSPPTLPLPPSDSSLPSFTLAQEPDKAPDYRSQTQKELDKVQQKAILLNDMLNNAADGERIGVEGDAYQQVALFCKQARPKIQKWIGEVSEDEPDSMGECGAVLGLRRVERREGWIGLGEGSREETDAFWDVLGLEQIVYC